ncbi:small glutamine-rich tetratricopeptide repeat-containing protein 2-like protein [Xylaria bambusicola]|uniref:small glutamine-rich tetratricopeptide repeat-containing protein 2-like protein n=1 Tax=Xylaria bambusicola TaxID=326684 RepID=UPI00200812BB|nr:small glutamine-rich tetratricopeptide repeat-containing protein 2-like protein [Xylaria bambusicola]KAI0521428.1 small glutamine-rich tetratricopeptide repeat-containing protein 2-like protein [Xylaria bambusicola]
MAAATSKQRLALAICDFLSSSLTDGTLSADDKDSIDVAINCIAESFKVDPADKTAVNAAIGSQNLMQIYGVYEKLKSTTAAKSSASSSSTSSKLPTDEEKARAEDLKAQGNKAMTSKDYANAIELYSQALSLYPGNAIFLSNRAAAYSAARDHESARADAEAAVTADPKYTKGWSRLGLARFALGDARGSMEAYRQGIEYEGSGGSDAMKKGFETAKRRVEEVEAEERDSGNPLSRGASANVNVNPGAGASSGGMPDLSSLAGMFGGNGGGNGGMPDLSSIMNNPMFANMAQSLMSNPEMMQNLMSNPRLREMADRFSQGGGMPDMSALMNDPNIAEMARNMMGGGGRGGPPGSGGQQ